MPAVAVIAHILPITIIIEIVDARNVFRYIVVARITTRRVVVIRIIEISVVVAITSIITARIARAIIVVEKFSGLPCIHARELGAGAARTRDCEHFALFDAPGATLPNNLCFAAQSCSGGVSILVNGQLVEPGFLKIDRAAWRGYFEGFTRC